MKHRNKHIRGDRMGEGTEEANSAKTTRISLSFPLSAGLPGFSAQKHCSSSPPTSSSDVHSKDGLDGTAWMEETYRDKQLSKTSSKTDRLPCSSSSFPVDLTAPVSKNCKSSLSVSVDGSGSRYPASPLQHSNKMDSPKETAGVSLNNGYKEHSTTETAHILFNLSARAYQDQGVKDPENSKGKKRKANSLHVELSLPLPSINPHSSSSTPPPHSPSSVSLTSSPLTHPTASFHDSFRAVPKPELLCGVCHRLFSTASSLTVHMRLHRGGRVLSCRHCGKAFIHNKRLQSHEATCRQGLPAFPVPPKEEPLEEGEVEGERTDEAAEPEQLGQETRPGQPAKKVRDLTARHAEALTCGDTLGDDDHFVKVVDGHIIYFCSVCERSYMTLSSLKRHSNVHSWRRKYPCHFCDKVFALAEYRTKHEVWHTGERRYQCIFCWEAFPTYYNLKTHQKAFHGINPGLISSEKTANGGYKQKVNALKLYRLLPMRSLKRPYKTYSQPMADGLLTSDSTDNLHLSVDGSLPQPLDTKKLESFLKDLQNQDIKAETEGFPIRLDIEQGTEIASPQTDMTLEAGQVEDSDLWPSGNNNDKGQTPKCPERAVSSVIAFARSKPSVIMHSTAVSSSVIVHRNKTDSEERKRSPEKHQLAKTIKKHSQKEPTEAYREWNAVGLDPEVSKIRHPTEKLHKGRKVHHKTESSKTIPLAVGSEVKGSGPLCQITVRIGEEAIVKRSISETDLRRDKSPTRSKPKKSNLLQDKQREQRHTHHHQRKHRNSNQEGKEREPKRKSSKVKTKVRKYFFRQEVREDRNDHDVEDNLWRPYYSYKPKRKALHIQGAKAWKRKMHYKRSLRPMRRAERLMKNHLNKDAEDEDADEREEKRQKEKTEQKEVSDPVKTEVKEMPHSFPVSLRTEQKEKEKGTNGKPNLPLPSTVPQATPNPTHTASSIIKQRWSEDQASECGTCGRWFSSPRKRDKHEMTHLFEFVCMHCRAPFPSQFKLEEHQRSQHPKNKPLSAPTFYTSQSSKGEVEMKVADDDGVNGRSIEKGSPVRLGRRPLIRYTCSKCDKVCKTSAALNCHLKRHELGSLTEVEDAHEKQDMPSYTPSAVDTIPSIGLDTNCEQVQPVSVIYYSKPECQNTNNELGEKMEEHQRVRDCESPKVTKNEKVHSPRCAQFSQVIHSPTLERFNVISPNLPSVLVMNGAECLDYRTPEKQNLEKLDQQKRSQTPSNRQIQVSQMLTEPQIRRETTPSVPISLKTGRGYAFTDCDKNPNQDFSDLQDAQDLRIFPQSSSQAQDLSRPTILAKKKELDEQIKHPSNILKAQSCNEEVSLLVPKEEPLSPIPSPTCSVIQTTPKGLSQRYSKSTCHSPEPLDLQLRPQLDHNQSHRGRHNSEKQGLMLPANSAGIIDPSSPALLNPQVPAAEPELKDITSGTHTEHHRVSGYPVQEYSLPMVIPGGYCSGKNQEEQILMSYPAGPLPFPPLGKMVPHADSTKLPFYPDPYHLLYGPQLLPYPYNLAALPMALNMMASGDKEPLPFLPFFNYAAAAAPLTGTLPHPLVMNPSLYNSGGSSSTKQDNP